MEEILKYLAELLIAVAIIILTRYLIPWIKSRIEASEYKWLYDLIIDAVQYAEQTVHGSKTGSEKKALVVDLIHEAMRGKKQIIPDEQINAIIESIVFTMNKEAA